MQDQPADVASRHADTSILFLRGEHAMDQDRRAAPACFSDLNLDQVVTEVVSGRREYDLSGFFNAPLPDESSVTFRQDVFRDLEPLQIRQDVGRFATRMRSVRNLLRQKLNYRYQRATWFFEAAEIYGLAITDLRDSLERAEPQASGLLRFEEYLDAYAGSRVFQAFLGEASHVRDGLRKVDYNLRIGNGRVSVSTPDPEPDYTREIETTFERFRRGDVRDYRASFNTDPDLNHVGILDRLALLYPETFGALEIFCASHADFVDPGVARFDREVQFYLAYLEFIDRLRSGGLPFCYPRVTESPKAICARGTFDLALAATLVLRKVPVVDNDFDLRKSERVMVVTGPNQGGKTTFARTFGQLHYFASLGCPVPGSEAELSLCDRVLTHFGREERLADLRSRLEDELVRMHAMLEEATPRSVLILNEVFTSTTLADAIFLSTEVMRRIAHRDLLCVWVTFVDELASFSDRTVSMVSNVLAEDPTRRTFKITRRPADGQAFAAALAAKYRVDYQHLKSRLAG